MSGTSDARSYARETRGSAIDVRGVTKVFGSGALAFPALRGIDLTVKTGELVMLAGPSGSGKTTLLSILGCVLSPTSGSVNILGHEISQQKESGLQAVRRRDIGFIFQGHNLIASLSARENVAITLQMRGRTVRESLRRADELLERVGLANCLESLPSQLSGGQRQRVAIARAVAGNPPLLFADEPTAALDAQSGSTAISLLQQLSRERGTTVVVVTHDARILGYSDRIVHIEDGMITFPPKAQS